VRRAPKARRDRALERQCVPRGEQADHGNRRPEREGLVLEDEPSGCRTDQPADLPGGARQSHVAAEQPRLGEVDDERRVDRAVQALAESEHADGDPEDDRRLRPRQPGAPCHHGEERARPDHAHQREPAHTAVTLDELDDGKLRERDDAREHEPQHTDRGLTHVSGVLRERRQQLGHDRDAGTDEDDVQPHVRDERAVAKHVGIAARLLVCLDAVGHADQPQDPDEDEERSGVQQKEERERLGMCSPCDRTGDEAAERDAEVHRHPLLCECRVAPVGRRQRAEQGRLARPEGTAARADEHVQQQRLPRRADQREEREPHRHHDERAAEDGARPDPVRERPADESGAQCRRRVRSDDHACEAQRDPAHVVQVDDQERPDHSVAEHVRETARLQDPDVARQVRVEASQVRPHGASLTTARPRVSRRGRRPQVAPIAGAIMAAWRR